MAETFFCPVCGYNEMPEPPFDHNICPCCGTEFGTDDLDQAWSELRARWIVRGCRWFSKYYPVPPDWHPLMQLWRAGMGQEFRAINTASDVTPAIVLSSNPRVMLA